MADLRTLVTNLGYSGVRTLLNSGNVVFSADDVRARDAGVRIESALAATLGVHARVTVITATQLAQIIRDNPLLDVAGDHSRLLVAVFNDPADRGLLDDQLAVDWSPGALSLARAPRISGVRREFWRASSSWPRIAPSAARRRCGIGPRSQNCTRLRMGRWADLSQSIMFAVWQADSSAATR